MSPARKRDVESVVHQHAGSRSAYGVRRLLDEAGQSTRVVVGLPELHEVHTRSRGHAHSLHERPIGIRTRALTRRNHANNGRHKSERRA